MTRKKKLDDGLCAFNIPVTLRIEQRHARAIACGGFLPRAVADQAIDAINELYRQSSARERIAIAVQGGDGCGS